MEKLTIYTATYNREKLLYRVYNSLCNQSCFDFVWMVIDDGSTDNTKRLVSKWQNDNKDFRIKYIYKKNQGIHTGRDTAFNNCETELIMSVDSDDWIVNDAVEKILEVWNSRKKEYLGIICLDYLKNGNPVSNGFPKEKEMFFQKYRFKSTYKGDATIVFKSNYIKAIPNAPVFEGEKLVGEGWKINQLPKDKKFILFEGPICIKEYQKDGYTNSAYDCMFKNPNGFREDYRQIIINVDYITAKLKGYIGYIACSLILNDKHFLKNSPNPLITFLLIPLGFFGLLYLKIRKFRTREI